MKGTTEGAATSSSKADLASRSTLVVGPDSARREMSAGAHFPALDGYRAIAALMVVLTHVAFSTGAVVESGLGHLLARFDFGVSLFFLMSGFLLYRPWARSAFESAKRPDLRRYTVRRAARIFPLYWVVVSVTLLVLPELRPVATSTWWQHLLAVQIYTPAGTVEGLTQTWSLCTEIAFYAALPVIGLVARGRRTRSVGATWRRQMLVLSGLAAIALVFNLANVNDIGLPRQAVYWLPAYLDWFAAGMALAVIDVAARTGWRPPLVRHVQALGHDQTATLTMAAAVFLVATTPIAGSYAFGLTTPWESMFKHYLYMAAATLFLIPGVFGGGRGTQAVMAMRWPHRIGLISYGIFLWHLLLIRLISPALGLEYFRGGGWILAMVVVPASIAVASLTYVTVERPAQRWAHRRR